MYTQRFKDKIIISGINVESYSYSKILIRNYTRRKRKDKNKDDNKDDNSILKDEKPKKSNFSINRTKTKIRRLVNSNSNLRKFLTLTSKITDVKESNYCFNLFTQRLKKRFPEFKYIAIIEFQKDIDFFGKKKINGGAVHYHLLCNLRYVKSKQLQDIWTHGFIKIKKVNTTKNLGFYLCKYLPKDMSDKRLFGKKKYFCSRDLKRPTELIGNEAIMFMNRYAHNLNFIKEYTFENDYLGKTLYKIFNFKRNV